MLQRIVLCFLMSICFLGHGQREPRKLVIEGTVLGYNNDYSKTIFKKGAKIQIQGSLPDAMVSIYDSKNRALYTDRTGKGGEFKITIDLDGEKQYLIKYRKKGYGTSAFSIDIQNVPYDLYEAGLYLKNVELILNNFDSDHPLDKGESFGKLYFDSYASQFQFTAAEYEYKTKIFQEEDRNNQADLMIRSVEKNVHLNKNVLIEDKSDIADDSESSKRRNRSKKRPKSTTNIRDEIPQKVDLPVGIIELGALNFSPDSLTEDRLKEFESRIDVERSLLEFDKKRAKTDAEKQVIMLREKLLNRAERDLENAKSFIQVQATQLATQKKLTLTASTLVVLLLIIGYLLWTAYRAKKRSNAIFKEKNKKINDSIDYALRIQRSVLLSPEEIEKIVPKFFVYYRPLQNVSGDFYWFSKVKNYTVVAAVDCTGHGVPGAFMSLIGNNLLNQIINDKQELSPGRILDQLHAGVVKTLNQEYSLENAQDGMDISLCVINNDNLEMQYAGAMNPVYVMKKSGIEVVKGTIKPIGGLFRRKKDKGFEETTIQLEKGDRIYLFSDGYMDQFGGPENKKFNISRFKDMLLEFKEEPMDYQVDKLDTTFENWKGNTEQIDDVLVIGIEI